jgi:hypothetical protein
MKTMKTLSKWMLAILSVLFMTVACDDMNSIIQDDLDRGETIYPGMVEYMYIRPGRGRAWAYWYLNPDSRVVKTVITWTVNGETDSREKQAVEGAGYRLDSLELTGLVEGYYSFTAYTVDKDGHRSIITSSWPENTQIYGDAFIGTLSTRGVAKTEMLADGNLRVSWLEKPADLVLSTSLYMDEYGEIRTDTAFKSRMLYSLVTYTDATGTARTDTVFNTTATSNLAVSKKLNPFSVRSIFRIGLDTASTVNTFYPSIIEKEILAANGLVELTAESAENITALTFPLGFESWTLQDLYFFPNLEELDLTQGTDELPVLTYSNNSVSSVVGGGPWLNCASGYMTDNNVNIIVNLLASGQLKKVKYRRNSYPNLDAKLEAYSDAVEWSPAEPLPNEIMIPNSLRVDYRVENSAKSATVNYGDDATWVPAAIVAKRGNVAMRNVYKVTVTAQNSTVAFSLPLNLQFPLSPYGTLKADVYIQQDNNDGSDYEWMKGPYSRYSGHKTVKVTGQTELSSFPSHSPYSYSNSTGATFPEDQLGTWQPLSWNISGYASGHVRVISLQMGEDGATWPLPSGKTLTYYFANLRFTK